MIKSEYTEQRDRHQKKINDFLSKYAFFAFNPEQFMEGLGRLHASKEDVTRFCPGGYMVRAKVPDYLKLAEDLRKERDQAAKDPAFAFDMFRYELANHEYSYTGSAEDAIDALGYTFDEIRADPVLNEALNKAINELMKEEN